MVNWEKAKALAQVCERWEKTCIYRDIYSLIKLYYYIALVLSIIIVLIMSAWIVEQSMRKLQHVPLLYWQTIKQYVLRQEIDDKTLRTIRVEPRLGNGRINTLPFSVL